MAQPSGDVTRLLRDLERGHQESLPVLIPLVYEELRKLAHSFMRSEGRNHTLQTTALVHEAYVRLVDQRAAKWQNRAHFFAIAAQAMRRILVDHARAHLATKRGGEVERVPLEDDLVSLSPLQSATLVSLDEALTRLATIWPRQSQVIELRFFGGLTEEEAAEILKVSSRTVKRDWRLARAWLNREI